jgi:dolichol-phosphate mannosyltransferase
MKIVIILATYNEKGNIEKIITTLEEEVFPKIKNHDMNILVADDNSPDGTGNIVRELMKKWKNIDISSGEKKGLGAAYVRGMTYAIEKLNADVMFEMDADLQHDPHKVSEFIKKIEEGNDMVLGNRYSDGGSIPENWPFLRKAFSIVANIFVRVVFAKFSIHDWTGGYRALKKEVFLKEKTELDNYRGYIFQISFLHKVVRDGFKIAEVPFHFSDRTLGSSKIAPLGYIIDVLKYVITARIIELQRVIKFLIVGGTGFLVQLLFQELFARVVFNTLVASTRDGLAAAVGAEAAILSNFMLNNFWTFSDAKHVRQSANFFLKMFKFNLTSLASVFIQFGSVYIFVHLLGDKLNIFGFMIQTRIVVLFPTIIFLVIPLNYIIYNKIIWKTQYLKNGKTS